MCEFIEVPQDELDRVWRMCQAWIEAEKRICNQELLNAQATDLPQMREADHGVLLPMPAQGAGRKAQVARRRAQGTDIKDDDDEPLHPGHWTATPDLGNGP
jgi:hypothetical protein